MHRPIAPYNVVLFDWNEESWPFRRGRCQRIQDKTRVKCCNERDVHHQPWRVLYLSRVQAIHFFPFFISREINFVNTVPKLGAFKKLLQACKTSTLSWSIGERLTANAAREDPSDDEWYPFIDAEFVYPVSGRLIVSGKNNHVRLLYRSVEPVPVQKVLVVISNLGERISILQHVAQRIGFLLTQISNSAHVSNDVFGFK